MQQLETTKSSTQLTVTIHHSSSYHNFYATVALCLAGYFLWSGFTGEMGINFMLGAVFSGIAIYFLYRARNKQPIYELNEKGVVVMKTGVLYPYSTMHSFRHESVSVKYVSTETIYFYNRANTLVLRLNLTGTSADPQKVVKRLRGKLKQL